jgi:hypothetical protein
MNRLCEEAGAGWAVVVMVLMITLLINVDAFQDFVP